MRRMMSRTGARRSHVKMEAMGSYGPEAACAGEGNAAEDERRAESGDEAAEMERSREEDERRREALQAYLDALNRAQEEEDEEEDDGPNFGF